MRSIKASFDYYKRKCPGWSSWICFAKAIKGRKFSKESIQENFNELVDENDYQTSDKMMLLRYLYKLTKDYL